MAGETSVSFKVYLLPNDSESNQTPEVRRFGIDRDVVCSFTYLQQKLQTIFPVLQGKPFKITWKDNDGDSIVISSDEELIIALTEMQTDVRKLFVKLVSDSTSTDSVPAAKIDVIHYGVTCDNCNAQNIQGFRYKCTECPDYDLCAVCEAKGTHSQHNMIRMAEQKPLDINLYYSKWMKKLGKRNRGLGSFCENYLSNWEEHKNRSRPSRCPYAGQAQEDHHGKKKRKSDKHESSPDTELSDDNWEDRHHHGKKSRRHNSHRNYYDWLYYGSPFWPSTSSCEKKDEAKEPSGESPHIKYLRTIGKTVADLLDPLGIDVDVEIRSKDEKKKKEAAAAKNEEASKPDEAKDENKKQEKEVRFADATPSISKDAAGSIEQMTEDFAKQKMSDVPEVDDFLWVPPKNAANYKEPSPTPIPGPSEMNNNGIAPSAPAPAPAPASAPTQPNQPGFIYPPLPRFVPPQVVPSQHPNPLVAQALDKMLAMGFTNDGGWLTQLLEAKNGDIYKALDVLQPVKK